AARASDEPLRLGDDQDFLAVHAHRAAVRRNRARCLLASPLLAPPLQLLLEVVGLQHELLLLTPPESLNPSQLPTNDSIERARLGCVSLRSAFASICRIRSRVTANRCPTSSSV